MKAAMIGNLSPEDARRNIISAVDHHMESMDEKKLIMVLKFIHSLKDF